MENTRIRKATLIDTDQLRKIGIETFTESFSSENSEENMKKYLENGFSIEKLEKELVDENAEFYFLGVFPQVVVCVCLAVVATCKKRRIISG